MNSKKESVTLAFVLSSYVLICVAFIISWFTKDLITILQFAQATGLVVSPYLYRETVRRVRDYKKGAKEAKGD